tara:strand:- start:69 stop:1121 length:1053 start_codon:yes stop_codon:yes gene_type:complete
MKKLFFFLLIILLFFSKTQKVFAQQDAFTVDNIIIEGKMEQNYYKDKYIEIGFRKGFQKLIANILKSEDQKKLLSTDLLTIKSLVQSFRVLEEKIFEDNYSAKIAVSFKEEKINDFFNQKGVSYSSSSQLETIVYPILILNSELQSFSGNKFFEEWNKNKELQDVNFILPVENLDDLKFIKKNVNDLETIDLGSLVDNYEIKNSAILILRYDKKNLNVFIKTNFNSVKKLKKIKIEVKNIDDDKVREETISKLKLKVLDIWKEQNLIDVSTPSYLIVNLMLDKPNNLEKALRKMNNINLIKNLSVQQINKTKAQIKVKYFGKIKNLQNLFLENGFKLKITDNKWNLTLKG